MRHRDPQKHSPGRGLAAALVFALCLPLAGTAANAANTANAEETAVRVDGQSVEKKTLENPVTVTDSRGQSRSYKEVYVVRLKGKFPRDMDMGLRLLVGEWEVPEYGDTPEGLYFKVFDPELLAGLRGKELRYRLGDEPVRGLSVLFDPVPAKAP